MIYVVSLVLDQLSDDAVVGCTHLAAHLKRIQHINRDIIITANFFVLRQTFAAGI